MLSFCVAIVIAIGCLVFTDTADAFIVNTPTVCPKGLFDCQSAPSHCISLNHVCDGKSDCANDEDESLDICGKAIDESRAP